MTLETAGFTNILANSNPPCLVSSRVPETESVRPKQTIRRIFRSAAVSALACAAGAQTACAGIIDVSKLPPAAQTEMRFDKDKADWWSFKTPTRPVLPNPRNKGWAKNPIDVFILAK